VRGCLRGGSWGSTLVSAPSFIYTVIAVGFRIASFLLCFSSVLSKPGVNLSKFGGQIGSGRTPGGVPKKTGSMGDPLRCSRNQRGRLIPRCTGGVSGDDAESGLHLTIVRLLKVGKKRGGE